ncbi:MlaE family lipid ABC transporter permease subunit [Sulfurimonas crateris]|uniref:MlaE family lipid ABC transporter permease subunit n=1 Tax=Sulfurimonas crateris TaxID=2574727 RepID=A0A4U2Z740_9BACT|nr:ABC transporter permease [Sulfurimonas crateris]TKI69282.1 MlaE family lipid ABC transporter permease subunit [Sulfurimonas crateris]
MQNSSLDISYADNLLSLTFGGGLTLYNISKIQKKINALQLHKYKTVLLDFTKATLLDSAAAIFFYNLEEELKLDAIKLEIVCDDEDILSMLALVKRQKSRYEKKAEPKKRGILERLGRLTYYKYTLFVDFIAFLGELFANTFHYLSSLKNIRYKEMLFEINESGVKALSIVSITTFLIGVVVAYQSAYQLKIYGANIFIVDMLGISILRELAPLITAIVIAGRSASAYTAQIGTMKITQELDAMKTMGFNPYKFLVLPRIFALMIVVPILIFVADIMGILGGMIIASIDLGISSTLFLDRFAEVIAAKHFFVGIVKGPFFGFLIAAIAIHRGLSVEDSTQSLGSNTTKSVVEAIFAVIICDAIFSIILTKLGI